MKASELGCSGAAQRAAELLEAQFPDVDFTSGRRDVAAQARAMATNVARNRFWISQTYLPTPECKALQAWVDEHPAADTVAKLQAGFETVMRNWNDLRKGRLSKHFSGEAWDVRPVAGPRGESIKAAIARLPGLKKFLEREGGLIRWHAQFA